MCIIINYLILFLIIMLKSFDIFRKIQSQVHSGSATGGFFTIIAFIIGGILMLHSLNQFYTVKYNTSLVIENDESPVLPIRLQVLFNKAPCHIITLKFHDEVQYQQRDLEKKLTIKRINKEGVQNIYVRNENRDEQKKDLRAAIDSGQQCKISGLMYIPKTPGTLKFQANANNNIVLELGGQYTPRIRMNYKLVFLQFGLGNTKIDLPIVHESLAIKKYIEDLQGYHANKKFVQDFTNGNDEIDYLNHIKVIPVRFGQTKQNHQFADKYRYSIRSGKAGKQEVLPAMHFLIQIEPINIVYHRSPQSTYHLVVRIFAIIGGVFATIGIVNSISQSLLQTIKKK